MIEQWEQALYWVGNGDVSNAFRFEIGYNQSRSQVEQEDKKPKA